MLRLSFIVPFYNVEPYIEECIRSLYNQDISQEEYEVICVDDCSPDGSRAIVERLQKEYPTLKLLCHTENKRQGGARNTGMREAQGKYIWFVDSDDYIKPNCLKGLLETAEKEDLDILKFYYEQLSIRKKIIPISTDVITGATLIFDVETGEEPMDKCCTVWCQLIKKNVIDNHHIVFAERHQYEDDDYAYQLFAYSSRVMLISEKIYYVRNTPNSTTRRPNDMRRAMDLYAQAIRMAALVSKLSMVDNRWGDLATRYIRNSISNQIFRVLSDCSLKEQICFWLYTKQDVRKLRPYLTKKSYLKICSFILWKSL